MPAIVIGKAVRLTPLIRRLTAPNPSVMTGPGTNTYLVGEKSVAVIDPGPAIQQHCDAIVAAISGSIKWIMVTHTHQDHSPAARLLQDITGAPVLGMEVPDEPWQDNTCVPDRILTHNERVQGDEFTLSTIHTPGHASNHLCYLLEGEQMLFSGDHIMNGATPVIAPPGGHMGDYLKSLALLQKMQIGSIAPGHGDVIETPQNAIQWIIDHRLERENKTRKALHELGPATLDELLPVVYADVDPRLHGIAKFSLHAHVIRLAELGEAHEEGEIWTRNTQ